MALPDQLLLSDLLRRRVRCDQGEDHGPGCLAWMHPPVHRLLGWISRPSSFGPGRLAWRLDQLCGLSDTEALVRGDGASTDQETIERLPTLLEAALVGRDGQRLGHLADAAVELRTGRILHYLVARSDPRLPGSSRWRLTPDRILDQEPGQVRTALEELDALPLARASVRQEFLRRSRRWREQLDQETGRWREQFQQVGDRFEDRLEGWLEEPPWESDRDPEDGRGERERPARTDFSAEDPLFDDWEDDGQGIDERSEADGRRGRGRDQDRVDAAGFGRRGEEPRGWSPVQEHGPDLEAEEDPDPALNRRFRSRSPQAAADRRRSEDPWI